MSGDDRSSRRRFLRGVGAAGAVAASGALAGCQGLPFGPGADAAYYHADGPAVDVDYDAVVDAARERGYTVEEPFYVGTREPRGLRPTGLPELDDRFGPGYRVFGLTLFYTRPVFLELWFAADGPPTVSVFDDSAVSGDFDVRSLPPEGWLVSRLTLAFEMGVDRAREHVAALREEVGGGTDIPSVTVTETPAFARTYESLTDDATASRGSETHGDGWYELTLSRGAERFAAVDFVVQSVTVVHRRDAHTYTVKLDRLGGFNLTVELPPREAIPEAEYRSVFRRLFSDIGLPPEVVGDLTFEYTPTVW